MKEFIEKLIGRLKKYQIEYKSGFGELTDETVFRVMENVIYTIKELAEEYNQEKPRKTKENQEWIPTSERLPEKNAIVLTCDKDGWISVKVNMPYAGVKNDFECGYYTAWMPLPPAYVPKEGRE